MRRGRLSATTSKVRPPRPHITSQSLPTRSLHALHTLHVHTSQGADHPASQAKVKGKKSPSGMIPRKTPITISRHPLHRIETLRRGASRKLGGDSGISCRSRYSSTSPMYDPVPTLATYITMHLRFSRRYDCLPKP